MSWSILLDSPGSEFVFDKVSWPKVVTNELAGWRVEYILSSFDYSSPAQVGLGFKET